MSFDMYMGFCIGFLAGGIICKFVFMWQYRNWQPKPLTENKDNE